MRIKGFIAALVLSTALFVGMAAPAAAQPVVTGGLVNVTIANIDVSTGDILSENTVQLALGAALGVAANICDVNVNVLAVQLRRGGAECTAEAGDQRVTIGQRA